jgi:diacylglycerol kinase
MSFFIAVSSIERALMGAVRLLAVIVELFNSTIEAVLDRISLEKPAFQKCKRYEKCGIIFSTSHFYYLINYFTWPLKDLKS